MMEFNNSRNLLTSQIKKILMTTRTCSTQTKSQIQELTLKLNLSLSQKTIQIKPSESMETTMRMPTTTIFPEDQTSSKLTTVKRSWESNPTDGKVTQIIPVQPRLSHLNTLLKLRRIQTKPSENMVTTMKMPTITISQEDQTFLKLTTEMLSWENNQIDGKETQTILDQLKPLPLSI